VDTQIIHTLHTIILTEALSKTFRVLGSAMSCSNRDRSRVLSGNVSHLPITTKSISLKNKYVIILIKFIAIGNARIATQFQRNWVTLKRPLYPRQKAGS
jgi:hypothetical protein